MPGITLVTEVLKHNYLQEGDFEQGKRVFGRASVANDLAIQRQFVHIHIEIYLS